MSKVVDTQPNRLDIFVYKNLRPKLRTPQPKQLCYPKWWTSLPNWCDIFRYGDSRPKLGTPLLDWRDVLVNDDFHLK